MILSGLRKMSLLDYPGLVACTIFTKGCNFRCPFCHNASLVQPGTAEAQLSEEEVLAFARKRAGILDGVVITGGEPLLHPDLEAFLRKLRQTGLKIKLDTNGSRPDALANLMEKGLVDYVAMDLKNSLELYPVTAGCGEAEKAAVIRSKEYLMKGHIPFEFRTTVVKGLHTSESLMSAARFIEGAERYYLQQYRDSGDILHGDGLSAYTDSEMHELLRQIRTVLPSAELRGVE